MKLFVRLAVILIIFTALSVSLLIIFDYTYILRGAKVTYLNGYKTAYIDDYTEFENRLIKTGENHQPWPKHSQYNKVVETDKLKEVNKDLETAAFLIIKNDSIWYENYYNGYGESSKTNSFSMAKSIVAALLGKAIKDGSVEDLEQPVADFIPNFDTSLKVGDLASMASGLNWDENYYNPFSLTARAYFDEDIRTVITNLEVTETPGEKFKYLSGNTQVLGMVLEKATGRTLSEYLSESLWRPLGMSSDALWQLDSKESGMEKAYCCIASNARDFAKIGRLYKDLGYWNGQQLIDTSYIALSTNPRFKDSPQYGYGFWLSHHLNKKIFYMRGVLGQYVIVIPHDNLIIVRLGRDLIRKDKDDKHAPDFFIYIEEAYKMLDHAT